MSSNEKLVQLSRNKERTVPVSRLIGSTLADKFFLAGASAGIVGIAWAGVQLWLSLNGRLPITPAYADLRRMHVLVQIYLFFGMFVLGFAAQAGPRLVGSPRAPSAMTLLWIPMLAAGVLAWQLAPGSWAGPSIVSAVFWSALCYAANVHLNGDPLLRKTTGRFILCGLTAFAISPFLALETAAGALVVYWTGLATLIMGTGQQFISAFLGGRRCSELEASCVLALIVFTACGLVLGAEWDTPYAYHTTGLGVVACVGFYVFSTRLDRARHTARHDALALAFLLGYGWAAVGGALLTMHGAAATDRVVHLWATGWATPVIFAVSGQIMGFMSGRNITKAPRFVAAIWCWQLVPIGRSVLSVESVPASPWAAGISAVVVLSYWCWELFAAERSIMALGRGIRRDMARSRRSSAG